jgi:hypothetical protein
MQAQHPKLSWTLTFCIAAIIIALTLNPSHVVLDLAVFDLWDKAQHTLAFALLVLPNACWNRRALPVTALAAALLGGAIELIQPLVGREASWGDFTADLVGVALGTALGTLLVQSLRRLQAGRAG